MDAIDWTEVQTVICVAKQGSLSAAARELGVNHSTILRRIQAFEQKHGVSVFVRESQGYFLSRHGIALLQDFEQIDKIMLGLQRRISDYDSELQGRLTITSTENIFASYLSAPLFEFARLFPGVDLDLLISSQILDMSHLEADVAIRPMAHLPDDHFGFQLFKLSFHFFAPKDMAAQIDINKINQWQNWIGYSGSLANSRVGKLLHDQMEKSPVLTANSFDGVAMAANSGLGVALLPLFVGQSHRNLVQLTTRPVFETDVFVTSPKDLSVSHRVNALMNHLTLHFSNRD